MSSATMPMTPAGRLRQRVTIQSRTTAQDTYGQSQPTWSDVATVWAEELPLSGHEAWQAQTVRPLVTHKVTIRFRTDVTAKCRFKTADGRYLDIESVVNTDGRKRFLECSCIELVSV